ncbi:hypothetical protein LTR91_025168 [Friedmanniomyces endolithicus]|uniref:Uncharacterized protein n=1 Tax=Friedmanniomyces endolithicus TaxID=329885 RepID=A0AAN6GZ97_9PEZI|nr:hypothetical protein LTR94_004606 [Friedmanniomyces endolithicus]KAK0789309.1 hypothetical protein LTR38_010961 [Friedmanniomyces endolithicus]KAK0793428.1 hypothetical protein LTR75_011163 [Friedmanniomyces endolithicus]KAK0800071.1 hypothetical protein LTR59_005868 [Friedmanniomyces endolithicus]KAK0842654.1 hypothetical protein LTR03_009134 [Friedmanniomyces endolithicus]
MERVVRRADLHSPARTPELEPEVNAIRHLMSRAQDELHFVTNTNSAVQDGEPEDDLDFCLFAAVNAAGAAKPANRIRLRSPTPQKTAAGFVVPERDRRYYFADTLVTAGKENYARVALSGAQVLALSRAPWPGRRLPSGSVAVKDRIDVTTDVLAKRKRPGKKLRIKIRTKFAISRVEAEKLQAEAVNLQAKAVAREAAEREKRVRTNRAKKLKRRAQEKAKKSGVKGDDTDSDDGD